MDYQSHYDRLITRAQSRKLEGYFERHHVIPKCLGGSDKAENRVNLTAEEHYCAHLLLVKTHPENYKLVYAANAMTADRYGVRTNNRRYGWLRRLFAEASRSMNTGKVQSAETCAKKSAATKGIPKSPEHNEKNRIANSGPRNYMFGKKRSAEARAKTTASLLARHFHHSPEACARIAAATTKRMAGEDHTGVNNAFFGKHHTEEVKAKLSAHRKGKPLSPEHREKIAKSNQGYIASDEARAKISAALKGRTITPEWRAKLSTAAFRRYAKKEMQPCQAA